VSEENLETVRRLAAAFNERDVDRFVAELDPEVEFHSLRAQLEGQPYVGHEGARRMFGDFDEDWEYLQIDVDDLRDSEDAVVATGRLISRGRASRVDLDVPVAFVWRLRQGKVVYGKTFSEQADALRAAGLA
jgi:ketosteroid isomerase-like protein